MEESDRDVSRSLPIDTPPPNCIIRHIHPGQLSVATYHGTGRKRLAQRFRSYDIILTTYQTLRSEWTAKGPLFSEEWFRVVLDEGEDQPFRNFPPPPSALT